MIDLEDFLEKGDSAEFESLTRKLLEGLLEAIHSSVQIEELWLVVESESRFKEMRNYWSGWKRPFRERQWEAWCRDMEKMAYQTRPYCLLCGECCQKGSPTLYIEDQEILLRGMIKRTDLMTLRFGEIGFSSAKNDLVLISEERVKIKEKPGSRQCLFFNPEEKGCHIYENRPRQCRFMECWNPDQFQALEGLKFLSRKGLMNSDDPLLPVIEAHEKRCDFSKLHEILKRVRRGGAFAQEEILDMVFYDQHLRDFLAEKQGIGVENQDFLFGRPLKELILTFGFQLETGPDGTFSLRPMVFKGKSAV
jgi:Fe-S-cluster containining protein